jgi:hypothetical protein
LQLLSGQRRQQRERADVAWITKGNRERVAHTCRPGMSLRTASHASATPIAVAASVTATASPIVCNVRETRCQP